jgi:hypothetical protein
LISHHTVAHERQLCEVWGVCMFEVDVRSHSEIALWCDRLMGAARNASAGMGKQSCIGGLEPGSTATKMAVNIVLG